MIDACMDSILDPLDICMHNYFFMLETLTTVCHCGVLVIRVIYKLHSDLFIAQHSDLFMYNKVRAYHDSSDIIESQLSTSSIGNIHTCNGGH